MILNNPAICDCGYIDRGGVLKTIPQIPMCGVIKINEKLCRML